MKTILGAIVCAALISVVMVYGQSARPEPAAKAAVSAAGMSAQRAVLDKYCVGCHNAKLNVGNLQLDKLDLAKLGEHAEIGEKVIRKLRAGMMPPAGLPRQGSLERPLSGRIYRGTWLLVGFPLLLAAFSVISASALPKPLLPPAFDRTIYKLRNTVERAINKLKAFRGVATRYDKRDYMYQATIDVATIKIWLRDLANTHPPRGDPRDRP